MPCHAGQKMEEWKEASSKTHEQFAGNGRAISMASAGCSHAWPHAVRNRDIASLLRRPLGRFRDLTDQL